MSGIIIFIIILWIGLISSFILSACFFFYLYKSASEDIYRQRIMLLVTSLFLLLALSRLFHFFAFLGNGGFENFNVGELSLENEILFTISQVFFYLALITIIFSFEKQLRKDKIKICAILNVLICITYFVIKYLYIFNRENKTLELLEFTTSYIQNIIVGIFGLFLSLMYLRISLQTSGDVMRKALMVFFGFIFLIVSYAVSIFEDFFPNIEIIAIISFTFALISIPFLIKGYNQ